MAAQFTTQNTQPTFEAEQDTFLRCCKDSVHMDLHITALRDTANKTAYNTAHILTLSYNPTVPFPRKTYSLVP